MMTPEDVLIESIAAASIHGDTPVLRVTQCAKLQASLLWYTVAMKSDAPVGEDEEE